MKLWISAGELSGDIQGGALLAELRKLVPHLEAMGIGGDKLAGAGQDNLFHIDQLSVMGVTEVLGSLPRILRLLGDVKKALAERMPDAVLLVDAPEFNFRVARMADQLGIPVYYFIPPKVWAWRTGRVKFLRRHVRRIFSILPFEVGFYERNHLDVTYIGNPLVDLVNYDGIRHIEPLEGRIGLMPGSRKKEVTSLLPAFAGAAELLKDKIPGLSFHCIVAPNFTPEYLRSLWTSSVPLVMERPDNRYAFMRTCKCLLSASGTATLESGLAGVPTIVAYKLNPLSYAVGKTFVKVPWISLTNLILEKEAFPEHIQQDADPAPLVLRLESWLTDPAPLARLKQDLEELRLLCGLPGSSRRAAEALWRELGALPPGPRRGA